MRRPTRKLAKVAQIISAGILLFPISNIAAPKIAGIERRNENFIASFSFSPARRPPAIVVPLLEIPGNNARAWAQPIKRAFFHPNFFLKLGILKSKEAIRRITEVIANPTVTTARLVNAASKYFWNRKPTIAAGMVPIIRSNPNFPLSLLKFPLMISKATTEN